MALKKNSKKAIEQQAKYPRQTLEGVLRIPKAILEQNAGKECSNIEAAKFLGVKYSGPSVVEFSSALKYGLIERPSSGVVKISELAKKILRPQNEDEVLSGIREAILKPTDISNVYMHYRGENLPDKQFYENALIDTFKIPSEKISEFSSIFISNLKFAKLIEEHNGKNRIIDISQSATNTPGNSDTMKQLGKSVKISEGDICFVMMPFAAPLGDYYSKIYAPAIQKTGLRAMRADDDIFSTGKIIDQVWSGINSAKILLAELTSRNPNVFYELGLAHALKKPVVLVSSNEEDVPFDLHHIRVIYYDVNDPFWGQKLIDKVAENILSALNNPAEAIFNYDKPSI